MVGKRVMSRKCSIQRHCCCRGRAFEIHCREQLLNYDLQIIAWNGISRHCLLCDNHQHYCNDNTNTNTNTSKNTNTNATVRAESCLIMIFTSLLGTAYQGIAYSLTTIINCILAHILEPACSNIMEDITKYPLQ